MSVLGVGAALAVLVLAGSALQAMHPLGGVALAIALLLGSLLALLVCPAVFGNRAVEMPEAEELSDPTPPPCDSISGTADRLRLLESAVIHAHDSVVILEARPQTGPGRSVLYVNEAFCRMTGYSKDDVIGRSLHFLRGPNSDPETLDQIRRALDANQPLRVELRNYRKGGTGFWVDLSLVPVATSQGLVTHWVMIQRDITDRKAAEDELRRSEERYRLLFDSNPHPLWVFDQATHRFLAVNDAAIQKYGYSRDEFLKLTTQQVCTTTTSTGNTPRDGSTQHRKKDGTLIDVETSSFVVNMDGRPTELILVTDVTERLRLEDQLRQSQKMEAIGQMAGGVAHDFNNLLTSILGNLALVQLPKNDPNGPLLAAAEQAAVRAADLTGKLLGFARRNQLVFAPVDPAEAFGEVVGLLRRTLDPRIRLAVRVPEDCGPVQADPTLLTQALMNLCLNARDAMPEGGLISLTAESVFVTETDAERLPGDARTGHFVRLTVSDVGSGMTDNVKARIFEPFFTTKEVGKGTGLGLPMVHGIVKQHHGWVTCTSSPGVGTRMELYLPPAALTDTPRPMLRSPAVLPDTLPTPAPCDENTHLECATDESRPTILLVDDESMIRNLGQVVLKRAGYSVLTAVDGIEALQVFARERDRIGLVILDVTMPRMSGRDAYRHIVEIDPTVRILFSTGYSTEDIAELDGAVGLLGKPYRPNELLAAVRASLAAPATSTN